MGVCAGGPARCLAVCSIGKDSSMVPGRVQHAVQAAELCVGDFDAQELANTAWAFAIASQSDALLFAMLAKAAKLCVGDFDAQELANTA